MDERKAQNECVSECLILLASCTSLYDLDVRNINRFKARKLVDSSSLREMSAKQFTVTVDKFEKALKYSNSSKSNGFGGSKLTCLFYMKFVEFMRIYYFVCV